MASKSFERRSEFTAMPSARLLVLLALLLPCSLQFWLKISSYYDAASAIEGLPPTDRFLRERKLTLWVNFLVPPSSGRVTPSLPLSLSFSYRVFLLPGLSPTGSLFDRIPSSRGESQGVNPGNPLHRKLTGTLQSPLSQSPLSHRRYPYDP